MSAIAPPFSQWSWASELLSGWGHSFHDSFRVKLGWEQAHLFMNKPIKLTMSHMEKIHYYCIGSQFSVMLVLNKFLEQQGLEGV